MAAKGRVARAGAAAYAAGRSKYVQRLIEDEELRANLVQAFDSARSAYGRLSNGKSPTKVAFDDKRFQKDVRQAAFAARDATVALREGRKKRKRRGGGLLRLLLLLLVGGGVAVAVNEGLRKKVLDLLFGAEEEFEYTSTTTTPPAPPAPTPPEGASTTT